jgi:hypothetical protein
VAGTFAHRSPNADPPRPLANLDLAETAVAELCDESRQQVARQSVDGVVVDLPLVGGTLVQRGFAC